MLPLIINTLCLFIVVLRKDYIWQVSDNIVPELDNIVHPFYINWDKTGLYLWYNLLYRIDVSVVAPALVRAALLVIVRSGHWSQLGRCHQRLRVSGVSAPPLLTTFRHQTPWRNGSASDSRSEGCVFESRRGQHFLPLFSWSAFVIHALSKSLVLRNIFW